MQYAMMSIAPGQHRLPPLPYPYNALEPVISAEALRIHHDMHHKAYVDGLNRAEINLVEARKNNDFKYINTGKISWPSTVPVIFSTAFSGLSWHLWEEEVSPAFTLQTR